MKTDTKIRVRYAPSPTGRLHVGGVRTALFNWLFARKNGGTFVLRIEDTDLERSTEEAVEPYTVRFKTPREGQTVVDDMIRGPVTFENANLEDFVLMKSTDTPTYNFAAAFDDAEMEISHVIRGDDHLSNTPRQILIHEALDNPLPAFAHVPQVLGPDKKKLSKRHGAAHVEEFAAQGYLPEALFNYLALLGAGYAADEEIFSPAELAERFRIDRVSGNPAILDEKKLRAVNSVYLRRKSPEELADLAVPMLIVSGAATEDELERDPARLEEIMDLLKERIALTTEIPDSVGYFYGDTLDYEEAEFEKQFGKPFARENFPELVGRLEALPEWTEEAIEEAVRGLAAEKEKGARHLIHPLRFAVTGRTVSAGLFETMQLLGRERSLHRARDAIQKMQRLPA